MTDTELLAFGFGVASGAVAIYVPWLNGPFHKYVRNCHKTTCPHHGADNTKRLNDQNERERHRKPPVTPL